MDVSNSNSRDREAGHSILEIAVVVMCAGILAAMSVAMFNNGKARYDLTRRAQNLSWEIERARSLAVKYNQTLTLGFQPDGSFGFASSNSGTVKSELASLTIPSDVGLSSRPTLTINGNGTISGGSNITLSDATGRQVTVSIANSGRVSVGSLTSSTGY
jgi:type II secretory pathway pseudopilin PulG